MCRFTRNGEPETGEYVQLNDGTGLCHIPDLNGGGEQIVVSYSDGTMPEGIGDLEIIEMPAAIACDASAEGAFVIPPDARERMAKTNLILEEYEMGVLDEEEAGDMLFEHLFGRGRNSRQ